MKRLVFKKWVEYLVVGLFVIGWVMIGAFEWASMIPYIIGTLLIIGSGLLLSLFGRDDETRIN